METVNFFLSLNSFESYISEERRTVRKKKKNSPNQTSTCIKWKKKNFKKFVVLWRLDISFFSLELLALIIILSSLEAWVNLFTQKLQKTKNNNFSLWLLFQLFFFQSNLPWKLINRIRPPLHLRIINPKLATRTFEESWNTKAAFYGFYFWLEF